MDVLRSLDFHPKLVSDFAVRTKTGAIVSVVAVLVAFLLFVSELRFFLTTEQVEHMEVDDASAGGMKLGSAVTGKILRVNFDISWPDLPCALVSLDATDASGANSVDVIHNVFKRRLDTKGLPVGDGERSAELKTHTSAEALMKEKAKAIEEGRHVAPPEGPVCGDCYGAGEEAQCCNTCEEVREAYR